MVVCHGFAAIRAMPIRPKVWLRLCSRASKTRCGQRSGRWTKEDRSWSKWRESSRSDTIATAPPALNDRASTAKRRADQIRRLIIGEPAVD